MDSTSSPRTGLKNNIFHSVRPEPVEGNEHKKIIIL